MWCDVSAVLQLIDLITVNSLVAIFGQECWSNGVLARPGALLIMSYQLTNPGLGQGRDPFGTAVVVIIEVEHGESWGIKSRSGPGSNDTKHTVQYPVSDRISATSAPLR